MIMRARDRRGSTTDSVEHQVREEETRAVDRGRQAGRTSTDNEAV